MPAERPSPAEERLLHGLQRRAVREERGLFLAEGVRVAEELVRAGLGFELAVVAPSLEETPRGGNLVQRLARLGEVRRAPEAEVRRLAATDAPQGIVVAAHMPRPDLESLELSAKATVLALDGVQDPGNFGTLVRSAHAFDAALVLAMTGTVDPWNPKSVRAAAGSSFHMPVVLAATTDAIVWLRSRDFAIFAADMNGEPVERAHRPDRVALAVGNEGAGVGDTVMGAADARVAVRIRGTAESLNVAVAAAILLYVLTREV